MKKATIILNRAYKLNPQTAKALEEMIRAAVEYLKREKK